MVRSSKQALGRTRLPNSFIDAPTVCPLIEVDTTIFMEQNPSWLTTKLAELQKELKQATETYARIRLLDELSFYSIRESVDKAEKYARKQMRLAKEIGDRHWVMRASLRLAEAFDSRFQYSRSRRYLRQAWTLLKSEPDNLAEKAYVCRHLAQNSIATGNPNNGYRKLCESLRYAKESGDQREIVATLGQLGEMGFDMGLYVESLEYMNQALLLFEEIQAKDEFAINGVAAVHQFLGRIHTALDDLTGALNHYHVAQELVKKTGDLRNQLSVYRGLGVIALKQKRYQDAVMLFQQALELCEQSGEKERYAEIYVDKGAVFAALEDYSSALSVLQEAEDLYHKASNEIGVASVVIEKAEVWCSQQQWENVSAALPRVLQKLSEIGMPLLEIRVHKFLAIALENSGNIKVSLEHYKSFMELERRLTDYKVRQKLMVFELHDHRKKADNRRKELQHRQEQLKREAKARAVEMAKESLRLARTDEFLQNLRRRIANLEHANGHTKELVEEIVQDIDNNQDNLQAWNSFEQGLQRFDPEFLQCLAQRCPSLTSAELRICSLLRMNLSNKEIAGLLNISGRTLDTHRGRIRKKLGLGRGDDIAETLSAIES